MVKHFKYIGSIATASGIQVLLLGILGLLLARILSIEDFGIVRTVTAYMVVLTMLGHFCLHDSVATYVAGTSSDKERSKYVISGSYLVIIIATAVTILSEIVIIYSGFWLGKLRFAMSITVLFLPLASLTIMYTSLLQAIGSYKKLTYSLIIGGGIPLVLIFPFTTKWQLNGWLFSRGISIFILLLINYVFINYLLNTDKFNIDIKASSDLMIFAKVQIFSGILSMIMQSADIILLERLSNSMQEVAIYGLAALFSKSILFLPGAVGRVYFKDITMDAKNGMKSWKNVNRLLLITFYLCCILGVVLFILVPVIINNFFASRYANSINILRIMCIGVVFSGLWAALSVVNIAMKKPMDAVIISITGILVCIISLIALIPSYGAVGAAWGMNGAYIAGTFTGLFLLFKSKINKAEILTN